MTLILSEKDVKKVIGIKDAIKAVESAFREYGKGMTQMPAKIYLHLAGHNGDFRAMPAYIERTGACALKWVNVHPGNKRFNLPTVMAIITLSDPRNGYPLCIMAGSYATALRTGAAGAVAAKYLARKDSKIAGMVGCGAQAESQLKGLLEVVRLKEVRVWGKLGSDAVSFVRNMKRPGLKFTVAKDIENCVRPSDIVITTTPSRKPIVKLEWLKKGCHINAIGADAEGKEELDPAILKKAKIVIDSWEQASHSGEINVPLSKKLISRQDIYADIGEIINGTKRGRINPQEITVFDSTGLAIQDAAVADFVYRGALRRRIGKRMDLIPKS
ncbi:MAG: alanine dehydrogenase [Candidatus Omnitrophica bacterium]|nr:alanine dehydrogenase [Candidatus Omnitrophota bacterium]